MLNMALWSLGDIYDMTVGVPPVWMSFLALHNTRARWHRTSKSLLPNESPQGPVKNFVQKSTVIERIPPTANGLPAIQADRPVWCSQFLDELVSQSNMMVLRSTARTKYSCYNKLLSLTLFMESLGKMTYLLMFLDTSTSPIPTPATYVQRLKAGSDTLLRLYAKNSQEDRKVKLSCQAPDYKISLTLYNTIEQTISTRDPPMPETHTRNEKAAYMLTD
jgi:hypothetical protein